MDEQKKLTWSKDTEPSVNCDGRTFEHWWESGLSIQDWLKKGEVDGQGCG